MKSTLKYAYAITAAAAVIHLVWKFMLMPDVMAVHFGSSGVPDGYSSRGTFFAIAFGMIALNVGAFAIGPWLAQRKRVRRLKLPNSGHWLSPENIDGFYAYFRMKMAWFGIVNLLFGAFVCQLVFVANSSSGAGLDSTAFSLALTAYFLFVIIWLFTFFRKLSRN
ncbi:MAG: DUF1648 domain-containing protein [Aridibacter famidurans]|nr:DUF1648 domain-containing protein [Aridibacter famidurans]